MARRFSCMRPRQFSRFKAREARALREADGNEEAEARSMVQAAEEAANSLESLTTGASIRRCSARNN